MTARLQLNAAPSCATWPDLVAGVARRSARIRLVATVATPSLLASLRPAADGAIVAELVVVREGGKRSLRRLSAPSCAEAADALALVIAITLDPASATDRPRDSTAAVSADTAAPHQSGQVAKAGQTRAAAREDQSPSVNSDSSDDTAPRTSGAEVVVGLHWHVDAAVVAAYGPAPRLMPGLGLGLLASWGRAGLWSPAVRLSAAHYWLRGLPETGGTADFALDVGGLDLCPFRLGGGLFALRACANVQAGRLFASGSRTFSPRSRSRPFVVLGGSTLVTASLLARLEANLALTAGRTLIEDEYAFANNVFYRVPALSLGFGLGLGLRFH